MACITTDLVEIHYKNPDTNSVVPSLNQEPVCMCRGCSEKTCQRYERTSAHIHKYYFINPKLLFIIQIPTNFGCGLKPKRLLAQLPCGLVNRG